MNRSHDMDVTPALPFDTRRFERVTWRLVLWLPVGCVMAVFRIALCVAAVALDRRAWTDTDRGIDLLVDKAFGYKVRWHGLERLPHGRFCMVGNHVTPADLMVLYRLPFKTAQLVATGMPSGLTRCRNHRVVMEYATREAIAALAADPTAPPVQLFPEGGLTNGTAMMRFRPGFVRLADRMPVVPIALRARVPLGIRTHKLGSSSLANLFWSAFPPYIRYDVTVLDPVRRAVGERTGAFVERVQQRIAVALGVPVADVDVRGKRQLVRARVRT